MAAPYVPKTIYGRLAIAVVLSQVVGTGQLEDRKGASVKRAGSRLEDCHDANEGFAHIHSRQGD
jgi:hypothetical protein